MIHPDCDFPVLLLSVVFRTRTALRLLALFACVPDALLFGYHPPVHVVNLALESCMSLWQRAQMVNPV